MERRVGGTTGRPTNHLEATAFLRGGRRHRSPPTASEIWGFPKESSDRNDTPNRFGDSVGIRSSIEAAKDKKMPSANESAREEVQTDNGV